MSDSISNLCKRLKRLNDKKSDEIKPAATIQYTGEEFIFADRPINVTPTAMKQLLSIARIPHDFFVEKLEPQEKAAVFNRLYEQDSRTFTFRFSENTLYGLVSDKYKVMDNISIIPILRDKAISDLQLVPVKCYLNFDHSKFRFVPENLLKGNLVPMIEINNSENGLGSLQITSGVFKVQCSNGLLLPVHQSGARMIHYGNADIKVPDIQIILNRSIEYMNRLNDARNIYLGASEKEKIAIQLTRSLGQKVVERVIEIANTEYHNGQTLYDVVNSVTRVAQEHAPIVQTNIETQASQLLAA